MAGGAAFCLPTATAVLDLPTGCSVPPKRRQSVLSEGMALTCMPAPASPARARARPADFAAEGMHGVRMVSLPTDVTQLPQLQTLVLMPDQIDSGGSYPAAYNVMAGLKALRLRGGAGVGGSLPAQWSALAQLRELEVVSSASLTGEGAVIVCRIARACRLHGILRGSAWQQATWAGPCRWPGAKSPPGSAPKCAASGVHSSVHACHQPLQGCSRSSTAPFLVHHTPWPALLQAPCLHLGTS